MVSLLAMAASGLVCLAWGQSGRSSGETANDAMYWVQRWHQAVTRYPYAGTVTVMRERGNLRSARVWHAVQGAKQIDHMEMLSGVPRTIVRNDREVTVWEGKGQRLLQVHEAALIGLPFSGGEPLSRSPLHDSVRYYRVVPLGAQRVANYQADVIGFQPTDRLRLPYRFWTEQKTGLLLKWQMLEMDDATPQAWDKANILREIAFSDVQVPAPVDFSALQRLAQQPADHRHRHAMQRHLQPTSLHEQGWAWRKTLPGYVVKQCYWRHIPGAGHHGNSPSMIRSQRGMDRSKEPQLLQCLVTDGLSRFSIFIGPRVAAEPPPFAHRHAKGVAIRVAGGVYADTYQLTAIGAVPQAALDAAIDALYRP